ncbi:MAG: 30S ribosome-binding factor RbfA [Planctomycetes bacterium]|nr:30S ribosome-binding factor RbfA [Planctomycetota bacterium]
MPSRRQERVARVIRESVSDSIRNHISDPRMNGLVSVTEVDISPNLRKADVFLTILSPDDKARRRTFAAIEHATRHIQTRLGKKMTSKYCPRLEFHEDEKFKKTLDVLNLIDETAKEYREKDEEETEEE